jgi:hypothetical protein
VRQLKSSTRKLVIESLILDWHPRGVKTCSIYTVGSTSSSFVPYIHGYMKISKLVLWT